MPFTYRYSRYHCEESRTYDRLEHAIEDGILDSEFGEAYALGIWAGTRQVMDHDGIFAAWSRAIDRGRFG